MSEPLDEKLGLGKSMNQNKLLSNAIVLFHFLWILLILATLPLLFVFSWFKYVGIIIIILNVLTWLVWRECPLYVWESKLRAKCDKAGVYNEAFVTHYVKKYFNIYIPKVLVRIFLYGYGLLVFVITLIK